MPGPDPFVVQFADLLDRRPRRVLDCGLGAGRNSHYLASLGHDVTGLDLSAHSLARALGGAPAGLSLIRGGIQALPFRDGMFDALISTHVLETMRLPAILPAVAEFRRVLRAGGLMLLVSGATEDADTRGGREIEPGTWAFDRDERVTIHLADREELSGWTAGFQTVARYLLKLEEPRSKPFCAQWAFIGQRTARTP